MKTPKEIKNRIEELRSEANALDYQSFTLHAKGCKKAVAELEWVLK